MREVIEHIKEDKVKLFSSIFYMDEVDVSEFRAVSQQQRGLQHFRSLLIHHQRYEAVRYNTTEQTTVGQTASLVHR